MLRILASLTLAFSVAALGCGGDDTPPAGTDGGGVRTDGGGVGGSDGGGGGGVDGGGGGGIDAGGATDGGGGGGTDGGGGMTGTGAVGDACMMDGDCDGTLVCRTMQSLTVSTLTFPGGYCTQDCGSTGTGGGGGGAMCPSGSECAGTFMGFGMGFCARTCTTVADCRTGYECRALFSFGGGGGGGGPTYCLPPGGGGIGFDGGLPGFP
jgi:hypothetical protein